MRPRTSGAAAGVGGWHPAATLRAEPERRLNASGARPRRLPASLRIAEKGTGDALRRFSLVSAPGPRTGRRPVTGSRDPVPVRSPAGASGNEVESVPPSSSLGGRSPRPASPFLVPAAWGEVPPRVGSPPLHLGHRHERACVIDQGKRAAGGRHGAGPGAGDRGRAGGRGAGAGRAGPGVRPLHVPDPARRRLPDRLPHPVLDPP